MSIPRIVRTSRIYPLLLLNKQFPYKRRLLWQRGVGIVFLVLFFIAAAPLLSVYVAQTSPLPHTVFGGAALVMGALWMALELLAAFTISRYRQSHRRTDMFDYEILAMLAATDKRSILQAYVFSPLGHTLLERLEIPSQEVHEFFATYDGAHVTVSELLDAEVATHADLVQYLLRTDERFAAFIARYGITADQYVYAAELEMRRMGHVGILAYQQPKRSALVQWLLPYPHPHVWKQKHTQTPPFHIPEQVHTYACMLERRYDRRITYPAIFVLAEKTATRLSGAAQVRALEGVLDQAYQQAIHDGGDEITRAQVRSDVVYDRTARDSELLVHLEDTLTEQVAGEELPIAILSNTLRRVYGSGVRSDKPAASLLLAGPDGSGKRTMATALARTLFGDENHVFVIDMRAYQTTADMARLCGSREHDIEGILPRILRTYPYGVLVFAHAHAAPAEFTEILHTLLVHGRITDGWGEEHMAHELIVVLTEVLETQPYHTREEMHDQLDRAIADGHLDERLVAAVDRSILLLPLTDEALDTIARRRLAQQSRRLQVYGTTLSVPEEVVAAFVAYGNTHGAGEMSAAIRRCVDQYRHSDNETVTLTRDNAIDSMR